MSVIDFMTETLERRHAWVKCLFSLSRESGLTVTISKENTQMEIIFLDASSHLYMRVCPSVRPSVCPSVNNYENGVRGASDAEYSALFVKGKSKTVTQTPSENQ